MIMRSRVAAAAPVATQSAPPMAAALRPDPAAHTPKPAPAHTPAPVPADPYAPSLFGEPIPFYLYPNSSVPVFCPTMEQFNDFEALVAAIEPLALRAGVCKIIPPRKWRQQLEQQNKTGDGPAHVFSDDAFPILKPIVQHFNGSSGIFHQYNVEFHRRLKLAQFFQTSQDASHRVPEQHTKKDEGAPSVAASEQSDDDDVCESEDVGIAVDYGRGEVRLTSAAAMALQQGLRSDALRARFQPAVARYRPQPDTDGEAACGPDGLATKQYTSDDGRALFVTAREHAANEELERVYWKNLLFQPPMYGADVLGTLFPEPEAFPTWNIRYLPGLLRRIGQRMPGVNDPYLYLGMWKATFAWHVEDMDLYSINYIHFGAPKAWYAIPVDARHRFEMSMQNVFAQDYKTCSQFLRHKAFLLSPRFLASQGIPYNRVVQRAGEIILTFPLGYHAGFNHGFNCAESVNFALDRWLDIARESKHCECVKDSVTIDLMEWFGDCSRADVHKDTCAVDSSATPSEHQTNKSKRVSPRRHAAAAAAMSPPPAASQTEPQHKRPPGRPRKTECTHPATASHSNTATSTTPATPTKRKSPSSPPDTQNSTNGGGGEPSPKRLAKPKRLAAQTQCRQRPSVRTAANKSLPEEPAVDPFRQNASLHTPVGTCGGCLRGDINMEDPSCSGLVECRQCGLTLHSQCSALAFDDGNYKCANCVMDTDQLSCVLCAYQNGLLLPVASKKGEEEHAVLRDPPEFAHFLCANFIDEVYFDFPDTFTTTDSIEDAGSSSNPSASAIVTVKDVDAKPSQSMLSTRIGTRSRTAAAVAAAEASKQHSCIMSASAKVCGIEKVSKTRYTTKCQICDGICFGAVAQCAHAKCFRTFHPMCLVTRNSGKLDWSCGKIYCDMHSF